MATNLSKEYGQDERIIASEPNIKIDCWRKAAVAANDQNINCIELNDKLLVPSTKAIQRKWTLSHESIEELNSTEWDDFDQFVSNGCGLYWSVTVSGKDDWKINSSCTCPHFLKK